MIRRAYFNPPGISGIGTVNSREWRAAEMPSSNGHATAGAVTRIYFGRGLALGGAIDGVRILAPETLAEATREVSYGPDRVLRGRPQVRLGFQLTMPARPLGPERGERSATSALAARSRLRTPRRGSRSRTPRTRASARLAEPA